jgi:hypothetical protein
MGLTSRTALLLPRTAEGHSVTIPADLTTAQRRHFYRRAALAPLCLCLVAGLHLARVWTCRQTPWKGGGFGMFSTVDDESARFLRCYLVTNEGEFPLPIPEAAAKTVAEIRAAPTPAALDTLAQRLAAQPWRWRDQHEELEAASIAEQRGVRITAAALRGAGHQASAREVALSTPRPGSQHLLEPIPHNESKADAIAHTAVRVECWRYRYDAQASELRAEPMLTVTAQALAESVSDGALGDADQ